MSLPDSAASHERGTDVISLTFCVSVVLAWFQITGNSSLIISYKA